VTLPSLLSSQALLFAIIALGTPLRVWQFAGNPSLELDALALARNIIVRSLRQLMLKPLLFDQVAPQGFLPGVKGVVILVANSWEGMPTGMGDLR
jgi:hypothetical protein